MPNIKVGFTPTATPQFTFDPEHQHMQGTGTIVFTQDGTNPQWVFKSCNIDNNSGGQLVVQPLPPNGKTLNVQDKFLNVTAKQTFKYTITVTQGGTDYTSPDPDIINDPPSGGSGGSHGGSGSGSQGGSPAPAPQKN